MKISEDDPRITAYALGEIEDAEERRVLGEAIKNDEALQRAVASIREMGASLESALGNEPLPELGDFEAARLGEEPERKTRSGPVRKIISWPVVTGLAAVLVVAFVIQMEKGGHREQAFREAEPSTSDDGIRRDTGTREQDGLLELAQVDESKQFAKKSDLQERLVGEARSEAIEAEASRLEGVLVDAVALKPRVPASQPSAEPVMTSKSAGRAVHAPESASRERGKLGRDSVTTASVRAGEVGGAVQYDYFAADQASFGLAGEVVADFEDFQWNTERYDLIEETGFRSPFVAPLSTFSIDVDTAAYANVRRFLNEGKLPTADAVRIEELINYFPYEDNPPAVSPDEGGNPFAVHTAQANAPWNSDHRLLRIALKGYEMPWDERPPSNLVFLLDVSGSMNRPNKLPLVKEAMELLVRRLDGRDRVAVVVYAGASGLVLPSTTANNVDTIRHALQNLEAGGSTNAGAGIELAYKIARENRIEGGNNRVILCTDGDFNVGQTDRGELADIAEEQAEAGVSLTILGFGIGNYKDDMLETLSNKGKGSYAYVDSRAEARKVFLEDLTSNIFKIAKDVKIQVEFNPVAVQAYRLIGYENRRLKAEDFNNDKKKAGDIGPGHTVVALYEVVPAGVEFELPGVDPLKYQARPKSDGEETEMATVKLRYKQPEGQESRLLKQAVSFEKEAAFDGAPEDLRFSAAVAAFGLRLRESESIGDYGYDAIEAIAAGALGRDPGGHRSEFVDLVGKAGTLSKEQR